MTKTVLMTMEQREFVVRQWEKSRSDVICRRDADGHAVHRDVYADRLCVHLAEHASAETFALVFPPHIGARQLLSVLNDAARVVTGRKEKP